MSDLSIAELEDMAGKLAKIGLTDRQLRWIGAEDQADLATGGGFTVDVCSYETLVIWAEESGALSDNNTQWSYGNGATGIIGIPLLGDWEIYGWSFQADVAAATTIGSTFQIVDMANGAFTELAQFATTAAPEDQGEFAAPIPVVEGTVLGFRTLNELGAISDARVCAWLRRESCATVNVS